MFLDILSHAFPGVRLFGTDISSSAISLAKRRLPGAGFFEIDVSKSAPGGTWDLVTMIDVAEHIEDDVSAFRNIRAVCGNSLLVVTLEGVMRSFEPQIGHVRNYQPGELSAKLDRAGFTVVRYIHWGWPVYSPLYRNMSAGIDAHHHRVSGLSRLAARLAYLLLFCCWPGWGDLVIAVAVPKKELHA